MTSPHKRDPLPAWGVLLGLFMILAFLAVICYLSVDLFKLDLVTSGGDCGRK